MRLICTHCGEVDDAYISMDRYPWVVSVHGGRLMAELSDDAQSREHARRLTLKQKCDIHDRVIRSEVFDCFCGEVGCVSVG